ncbi:MAG: RNA polymerase factor sigma-32 [Deltaproteobacteria bacterium]|nr:RNA polymerase factor sigma-32 [Deltaproteobacteria bacterium]
MAKAPKKSKISLPEELDELRTMERAKGEKLAPYDPLRRYLHEISSAPILSKKEERELTIRYREFGDKEAAFKMVVSNLRLVVKIALEYHHYWTTNLLDLIQEGNVGLMQALKRFDPYRGVRFTTYASFWIRAYILKFIMGNWRLVRIGTTQAQRKLFFDLKKEKERLEKMGFDPVPKLVAESLNVKEDEVVSMDQRMEMAEISLDTQVGEDSKETFGDLLPAGTSPQDERLGEEELRKLFAQKLGEFRLSLNEREQEIFERRMMAEKPLTLREIGQKYNISLERVRQIEGEILEKAREFLRREMPDFDAHNGDIWALSD